MEVLMSNQILALAFLSIIGCSGASETTTSSMTETATTNTGSTGTVTETATTETDPFCEDGTSPRDFDAKAVGGTYDAAVADFSIPTLAGELNLSEVWTGCDSYVFINISDGYAYSDGLMSSSVSDWLEASPRNVHYIFSSFDSGSEAQSISDIISPAIATLSGDNADYWAARVHFSTDRAWDLDGGLGTIISEYAPWVIEIDRFQNVRETGYLSDPLYSWETTPLAFLNYEVEFLNFEVQREEELALVEATTVRLFDAESISDSGWAGARGYTTVTLPSAAEMEGFDTLELDLTMACGHPHYEQCPEWDYLVYAYICDDEDSTSCGTEIGRFITTYARPGRWVVDVTPFLAMMLEGGEKHFAFYTQQPYDITLDMRLSNQDVGYRPFAMEFLWSGGTFDVNYNKNHPAISLTVPDDATRVEIEATTSGHGYSSDANNCGEFCNHQHEFTVNGGTSHMQEFPEAEGNNYYGCAERASEGVVPGQYGTWVYGRGGWCPGLQVDQWRQDVTTDVTAGSKATFSYRGLYNDSEVTVTGTDARIDLTSYAVYYK
jgi:hypothetical protein